MNRSKTSKGYRLAALVLALLLVLVLAVSCGGSAKEEEEKAPEEPVVEFKEDSPIGIANTYVGKPVQELIEAVGSLKEDPLIVPANDGGGYEGTYEFDGFTAYTYAGTEDAEAVVTEIVPDEESKVYKESLKTASSIKEDGTYDSKDDVAEYLSIYKKLPKNYITKKEAKKMGWKGGSLEKYAPGKCIGGDRFGNREKKLPDEKGRTYYECDIDTLGAKKRGAKRIIYSNDGMIYYTDDHYLTFEKMKQSA